MSRKQPNMNVGAAILFVIFGLLFFVLAYRFVEIQVTGEAAGQALAPIAQKKYLKERVIEAKRGTFFDRKGEVIAEDINSYRLVAILDKNMTKNPKNPKHVKDAEMTAGKLSKYIEMSEEEIYKRLTKKKFQVEFGKAGRDISHKTKMEIEALKLPGITFARDSKRFYPNGIFSSHLVGFVEEQDKDGKNTTVGKLGLEKSLNRTLAGKNGSLEFESDLWGYLLPNKSKNIDPAVNGNDVYLTIDKKIQTFLEDAMSKVDEDFKPKKIIAVVANPKTGAILAMGQRPTFHPQTREGLEKTWHNEAVEESFEPGSTMKIFTLAAAVQEKKFNPNEPYKSGSFKATENSKGIKDHNGRGWGTIPYLEGVQRSSNVAFAKLVKEKIGYETFRDYLTKFGFDEPTGIDLPNEASGKIVYRYPIEKITTSYGQGSAITPIQQIQAATAVANDGKMMKPHVIEKIVDPNTGKLVKETKPEIAGTPISPETAKEVRNILETVVTSPKGTGGRYHIEGYDVAGKTGTAQISGPGGQYLTGAKNYVFSFLGMAPKDDPKLVIYVAVQQPEIDDYSKGSIPVSMIFNTVMKSSLQYLNIEPSVQDKAVKKTLSATIGEPSEKAVESLGANGFEAVVLGDGRKVTGQLPDPGSKLLEGEKVIILTGGTVTAPDMTGWSLRDVMKVAELAGLELNSAGKGYVTKQSIQPGAPLRKGESLIVTLETPLNQMEKVKKEEEKSEKDQTAGEGEASE